MKKLTGSFRYTQWDPWLIIFQIVSVQCILYVTLGLVLTLLGVLIGDSRTLDHIFEYHVSLSMFIKQFVIFHIFQEIHVRDNGGRMVISAFVINSLIG